MSPSTAAVVPLSAATDANGNRYVAGTTISGPFEARFLRTRDLGATWQRISAPRDLASIVPDPVDPAVLYGLGKNGIYRTGDAGVHWTFLYAAQATSFVVDPANRQRLAALTARGLIRSLDGGATWVAGVSITGISLATDPTGSGALLLIGPPGYISRDWGATVKSLQPTSPGTMSAAAFDPTHSGRIYAGTSAGVSGWFYVSDDFGSTWTARTSPPTTFSAIQSVTADPEAAGRVFVSTPDGLFQTSDGGQSWRPQPPPGEPGSEVGSYAVVSRQCTPAGGLFAKASDMGLSSVSFSLDGGATWKPDELSYALTVAAGPGCSFYVARQPSTDVVITKRAPDGTVLWSGYLGGVDADTPVRIVLDGLGSAYVAGSTSSPDFPATAPRLGPVGPNDVFLTKLSPAGQVEYSVRMGGDGTTAVSGLAVDSARNAYITGSTTSSRFPVTAGVLANTHDPDQSAGFLAKFDAAGALVASTFLGGAIPTAIAVDAAGTPIVLGHGEVPGQPAPQMGADFLLALDPSLSSVNRIRYFDTASADAGGLAMDSGGNTIVAMTGSASATPGAYESPKLPAVCRSNDPSASPLDALVEKLRTSDWSTTYRAVIHGRCGMQIRDLAVDRAGAPTLTVSTGVGLPLRRPAIGAPLCETSGMAGAVVRLSADGSRLDYASYLDDCSLVVLTSPPAATGPSIDGVANAFSGDPTAVVRGGLLTVAVSDVTLPSTDLGLNRTDFPLLLNGVEARFDGLPAGIVQTAPGRVVVIAPQRPPRGAAPGETVVQLLVNGAPSNVVRMPVSASSPGLLTQDLLAPALDAGLSVGYALNADSTLNSPANPAAAGSTITVFVTGLDDPPVAVYASWAGPGSPDRSPETVQPVPGFTAAMRQIKLTVPSPAIGTDVGNGVLQLAVGLRYVPDSSAPLASNEIAVFVK